ncbi:MAG: peptide chain release factor N(5)-glutamine methyltransferase, partial [Wenzhouxiangellaceae bacterium]|nr:peptide chain release factor N(5)-glutamine methyltransferase [Wenzhouxiangellaceae bacterium]
MTAGRSSSAVSGVVAEAARRLDSRLDAEILVAHGLHVDRSWLYAHGDEAVPQAVRERIEELVSARQRGVPVAYLLGEREFHGRTFLVDERVLVPRPETELLVEWALKHPLPDAATVADIGTGTGCIALTLAAERPGWHVLATDVSDDALRVASENRERLGLQDRVELLNGDLLEPLAGRTLGQRV